MTKGVLMENNDSQLMEDFKFYALDDEGNEFECEALFMFDSPAYNKSYIVYTDNSLDEDGNTKVYASSYNPDSLKAMPGNELVSLDLTPIETEEEWQIIEDILNQFQAE